MTESDPSAPPKQAPDFELTGRYKRADYWERGSKSNAGEPFASVIQIGVGHALTNWEHVENAVSMLFSQFTESSTIAAARAYGTIIGARARHSAVSAAMDVFFDIRKQRNKKDRETCNLIIKHKEAATLLLTNYLTASKRRNDIAHGICWELSRNESVSIRSWFLVPATYNTPHSSHWIEDDFKWHAATGGRLRDAQHTITFNKMYYKNADYVFATKEIKTFAGKFAYLSADILSFLNIINPEKYTLNQKQLHDFARAISGMT
jgi:hypothetical protein